MRETLHIRLRDAGTTGPVAYAVTSTEPPVSVLVQEAPLAQVLELAPGKRILLYAPSQDVRLIAATVPVRQPTKALAAVPYVLEDQFAEDVESLHFAIGATPASGNEWPVAVVADSHMQAWLAPFKAANLVPEALIPETLALPLADERWTVLAEADHISVRTGRYSGFGCLPEDFDLFLGLAEGLAGKRPLRILISHGVNTDFTNMGREVDLLPGLDHPLQAFARSYVPANSINLLQGPYMLRQGFAREWQAWKSVAGLCGLALLLGMITNGCMAFQLSRELKRQETANATRFHELFPTETRIVDLRSQAEQQFKLLSGGKSAGLMPLLDALAGGMKAAPSLQMQGLQYREGALFVSLTGSDLSALDALQNFYSSGHSAKMDVQSANSGEGGLQIRMKLSLS